MEWGRLDGWGVACLNADRIWACTPQIADDTEGAADAESGRAECLLFERGFGEFRVSLAACLSHAHCGFVAGAAVESVIGE